MPKNIRTGDLVTRPSYGKDVLFQVIRIDTKAKTALLRGYDSRLMADAPLDDLEVHAGNDIKKKLWIGDVRQNQIHHLIQTDHLRRQEMTEPQMFRERSEYQQIMGSVLHIDGDEKYMEYCLSKYNELKITANGYYIDEEKQPARIQELLHKHRPDVLVITGHDGMKHGERVDLNNYYNSLYFVECVHKARQIVPDKDSLVIFAGACQSCYEALIEAGANFASSPNRINIHTLDPVKVVEMIVKTSIKEVVPIEQVIKYSISGVAGVGGIESRGKMRLSLPKF